MIGHRVGDQSLHVTYVPKTRKLTPEDSNQATKMAVQGSLRVDTALMTTEDGSSRRYARKFGRNRGANGVLPLSSFNYYPITMLIIANWRDCGFFSA